MSIQFDNKISLGHVISIVGMLVSGGMAYATITGRQDQFAAEMHNMQRSSEARESRIRAVEISLAGQSSDLRSIQVGISRIEAQLEKIQPSR
jgi:ribosomal protein S11